MNLYLTGYRGSGKSQAGQLLGRKLARPWVDTDELIQREQRLTIAEIFEKYGEPRFRKLEFQTVEELARHSKMVVSLGGGAILDPRSRKLIASSGKCVWLQASPETLHRRLQADGNPQARPALTTSESLQEIKDLLKQRQRLYEACADYTVDTETLTIEQVVEQILKWWSPD